MNILIIWDRMGDYHRARIKACRKLYPNDVFYTADLGGSDALYGWENTKDTLHFTLSEKPADKKDIKKRFKRFRELVKKHQIAKVVLSGYGKPEYLIFSAWLALQKIDLYYFAESWYPGRPLLDRLKGSMIRNIVTGIFASGKHAAQHFSDTLGFRSDRILEGYSVVDNEHFKYIRSECEVQKSLSKTPTLLCVARHAPEKNLEQLIRIFKKSELAGKWKLKIIGGGPLTSALKKIAGSGDGIELVDWLTYDSLPQEYKLATAFILPSTFEPWGLVVNEAMAASLPILISDSCGCLPDLLDENGWCFTAEDHSLLQSLNDLARSDARTLCDMGEKSNTRITTFSPETWAHQLHKLLQID